MSAIEAARANAQALGLMMAEVGITVDCHPILDVIGPGTTAQVRWVRQNDLYYVSGYHVTRILASELFTRSLYSSLLNIGAIVGKAMAMAGMGQPQKDATGRLHDPEDSSERTVA